MIITTIVISAEWNPLLDMDFPQSAPNRLVLRHPCPSCYLNQVVAPFCMRPTNTVSSGPWTSLENFLAPSAVSVPRAICPPTTTWVWCSFELCQRLKSGPNLMISVVFPQIYFKHSPFHHPLSNLEFRYQANRQRLHLCHKSSPGTGWSLWPPQMNWPRSKQDETGLNWNINIIFLYM